MSIILESPLVSCAWLADHLGDPSLRILDCYLILQPGAGGNYSFTSGYSAWREGHIPNSIYVDVEKELSDPDHDFSLMMPSPERFAGVMQERGIGDGTAVICYDRGNHAWAARVWWMLRVCGFDNAAVLDGGWQRWLDEDRPVSTEETAYAPASGFSLRPRPGLMADKAEVLEASRNGGAHLLHSLPLAMFTGEAGSGRIPGSTNLYCGALVDPDTHCYVSRESLHEQFGTTGSLHAERVITYCGAGIAASSNALALTLLGHDDVAVYDGSLTEWTADPAMPMEKDQNWA